MSWLIEQQPVIKDVDCIITSRMIEFNQTSQSETVESYEANAYAAKKEKEQKPKTSGN